jgi:hypothetical protein
MALTQDYGSRLEYYGLTAAEIWPTVDDIAHQILRRDGKAFNAAFRKEVRNKRYFLVTDFPELKKQPNLNARLQRFPVFAEGEGYIIYQLRKQK